MCFEEIEGMTLFVCRNVYMLCYVTLRYVTLWFGVVWSLLMWFGVIYICIGANLCFLV